ncbi:unnamed protein product [Rotaria magnacalcarata]|uniref:HECT domain-containing protein n=1 Tax=Rotaria magnacalcarata TaxID=392030 RepID=A0A8S2MB38_9BILA|nr:unnamed protein product [Rotaria magnacalcarata]
MQTCVNFRLSERIQNFMSQLLIVLLSTGTAENSRTIKTLQMMVMDFVYLDLLKQKSQLSISNNINQKFELKLSELPQKFQDVWMIIDIINAITDQTKKTPYPDLLFIQAHNILDKSVVFTLDDVTVSSNYFDNRSDLQLINLMNSNALIAHSFSEFIHSLGSAYAANSISFELYPSLLNIPANCVQNRARLFHVLGASVEKVLSLFDFTFAPGKSILADKIRVAKIYLLTRKRMAWLEQSLKETTTNEPRTYIMHHFPVFTPCIRNSHWITTFNQGYRELHRDAHVTFRSDLHRYWREDRIEMDRFDRDEPSRESITGMCADIFTTRLPLFILCPNDRTNNDLNRDRWIPNVFPPNQLIPGRIKKQYRFVGQLVGIAIRRKHYLDLKFPNLLWKQLVDEQLTMKDIEDVDIQSFVIIKEIEDNMEKSQSAENGCDTDQLLSRSMTELRFDIVSSAGHIYELIRNGKDIPVTVDNVKEYCTRYCEYRLNEFHRQIEYIRQGLYSVVPKYFLTLLTASELEEAVCGNGRIDVELLKRNTRYKYSSLESPYIQRFWKVLSEMFNENQKKLFLKFVWGRTTLPSRDEDFKQKFSISLIVRSECEADKMLPLSNTRLFGLHLPSYSTTEIMHERLNYSITYRSSNDDDH